MENVILLKKLMALYIWVILIKNAHHQLNILIQGVNFMRCVSCITPNVIVTGLCRNPSLRFCDKFDDRNPYICSNCLPKYFLTSNKLCK